MAATTRHGAAARRGAESFQEADEADREFLRELDSLRREIRAHCYRMTGGLDEAEDLVQETYLRAWRARHGFEGRSSLRTWLYRIATNTCLTHLSQQHRRPLPIGLGGPPADPREEPLPSPEITWLEPMPDHLLWSEAPSDPGDRVVRQESIRLAFIAALQHLTASQRAALLLRDVLGWRASEVADTLGTTIAAVNSSLQRARARLATLERDTPADSISDERHQRLLAAYLQAFERYDVSSIVALLAADVVWEMPPFAQWYRGSDDVADLITRWCPARRAGDMRLRLARGNGQPVIAVYMRDDDGIHRPFQLQHLTVHRGRVSRVTAWFGPQFFAAFGLPATV